MLLNPYRFGVSGGDPLFSSVKFGANFTGTNGQTTAVDFSSSARAITFNGSAAISTAQSTFSAGSSLDLVGASRNVSMPSSSDWSPIAGEDFCWELVIYVPTLAGVTQDLLATNNAGGVYPYRFYIFGGGGLGLLAFDTTPSLVINTTGGSLSAAAWHHVAFNREGSTVRIWIDGALVQSIGISTYGFAISSGAMQIGAYQPGVTDGLVYVQSARYTKGSARYTGGGSFTPPSALFPTS